jgi:hypothetical protein
MCIKIMCDFAEVCIKLVCGIVTALKVDVSHSSVARWSQEAIATRNETTYSKGYQTGRLSRHQVSKRASPSSPRK